MNPSVAQPMDINPNDVKDYLDLSEGKAYSANQIATRFEALAKLGDKAGMTEFRQRIDAMVPIRFENNAGIEPVIQPFPVSEQKSPANVKIIAALNNSKVSVLATNILQPPLVKLKQRQLVVAESITPNGIAVLDDTINYRAAPDRKATFTPHYKLGAPDEYVESTLAKLLQHASKFHLTEAFDALMGLRNALLRVQGDHAFTNGTLSGQIGRLTAGLKAAKEYRKVAGSAFSKLPHNFVKKIMQAKSGELPSELSFTESTLTEYQAKVTAYNEEHKTNYKPVRINLTSDAGPLWGTTAVKSGQVIYQNLELANVIMARCAELSDPELVNSNRQDPLKTFWKEFSWLQLARMKNKAEVYTREKHRQKSRNYFAVQQAAFYPAAAFFNMVFAKPRVFPHGSTIAKLNVFKGGLDRLLDAAIGKLKLIAGRNGKKGGFPSTGFVYSDNVYFVELHGAEVWWISADGKAMESSTSKSTIEIKMKYRLDALEAKNVKFHNAWRFYLEKVFPTLAANAVAVFGPVQIRIPHLLSGVQGTFYENDDMSEIFLKRVLQLQQENGYAHPLVHYNNSWEKGRNWLQAQKEVGVTMKVEHVNKNFGTRWASANEMDNVDNSVVVLDLLGYDAVPARTLGRLKGLVPVLDKDRLLAAVTFSKSRFYATKANVSAAGISLKLLTLIRLRVLYVIGGWYYPETRDSLPLLCRQMLSTLTSGYRSELAVRFANLTEEETRAKIRERLAAAVKSAESEFLSENDAFFAEMKGDLDEEAIGLLGRPAVPSLFVVARLNLPRDQFENWVMETYRTLLVAQDLTAEGAVGMAKDVIGVDNLASASSLVRSLAQNAEVLDRLGWNGVQAVEFATELPGLLEELDGVREDPNSDPVNAQTRTLFAERTEILRNLALQGTSVAKTIHGVDGNVARYLTERPAALETYVKAKSSFKALPPSVQGKQIGRALVRLRNYFKGGAPSPFPVLEDADTAEADPEYNYVHTFVNALAAIMQVKAGAVYEALDILFQKDRFAYKVKTKEEANVIWADLVSALMKRPDGSPYTDADDVITDPKIGEFTSVPSTLKRKAGKVTLVPSSAVKRTPRVPVTRSRRTEPLPDIDW
jgi:hypothetical protein